MSTTAQLNRRAKSYGTHLIAIFLTKKSHSTLRFCLLNCNVTMLFNWEIASYFLSNSYLHLSDLFGSHLLEMRAVEPKYLRRYIRTLLLNMTTQLLSKHLMH